MLCQNICEISPISCYYFSSAILRRRRLVWRASVEQVGSTPARLPIYLVSRLSSFTAIALFYPHMASLSQIGMFFLMLEVDRLDSAVFNSAFELQEPSSTFYTAENRKGLVQRLDKLDAEVRAELKRQGFDGEYVHTERMLNMRFEGTDTALMVLPRAEDGDGNEDFEAAFKRVYKAEFGFLLETKTITVDDVKVSTVVSITSIKPNQTPPGAGHREDFRHTRGICVLRNGEVADTIGGSQESGHDV